MVKTTRCAGKVKGQKRRCKNRVSGRKKRCPFHSGAKKTGICWPGYKRVSGTKRYSKGSCQPAKKRRKLKRRQNPTTAKRKKTSIPERYRKMGFTRVGQEKKSTRKGKKWMVLAKKGNKYKVVHGGWSGMKDFTQHKDPERRKRFWSRMGGRNSAKARDPFSPLYWHKRLGKW
jgi:hypothetical protein